MDCELELIPQEIHSHPAVTADSKRRGIKPKKILLDSTLHHSAIMRLPEGNRRGRPDIVHMFLLTVLDSTLNRDGELQVFLHLRGDKIVFVDPQVRIPRSQNRFYRLMEQLLLNERVPLGSEEPFFRLEDGNVRGLVSALREDARNDDERIKVVALKEGGRNFHTHYPRILKEAEHIVAIFGGFPRGDFKHSSISPAQEKLSLHMLPVSVWCAAGEVLALHRRWRCIEGITPPPAEEE